MNFDAEFRQRATDALKTKNAVKPCPRCGNQSFTLIDGMFKHFLQLRLEDTAIGGPSVPTIVVGCTNCGWLAEHAMGALGLLPEQPAEREKGA